MVILGKLTTILGKLTAILGKLTAILDELNERNLHNHFRVRLRMERSGWDDLRWAASARSGKSKSRLGRNGRTTREALSAAFPN